MAALFTTLCRQLAGEDVILAAVTRKDHSPLSPAEADWLEAARDGVSWGCRRSGTLRTPGGVLVATVTSVFLPQRLPFMAVRRLAGPIPLGRVLEPYGITRETLKNDGPRSAGRLLLPGGIPVAVAAEELAPAFAR